MSHEEQPIVSADEGHGSEDGRLHVVTTRFTCHGGAPVRWTAGPPTDRDQALCRLEDAMYAYRVPEEVRSIQGLERRGSQLQEDVLLTLAGVRRQLLAARLREAAAPFDGTDLVAELEEIGVMLRTWVEDASDLTDDQLEHRTRELNERERLVRSLEGVLAFLPDDDMPTVYAVGEAGTASLRELEPSLEHATELLGLEPHKAQGIVERVRRFPVPEAPGPGRERFGEADANPLSHIDRVEAIDAVYELFSVPRAPEPHHRCPPASRASSAGRRPPPGSA